MDQYNSNGNSRIDQDRQRNAMMASLSQTTSPKQADRTGAVPARLGEMGQLINDLACAITELEKRLSGVLSPLPPSTEACGSAPCGSSVAERIGDHTRHIDACRSLVVQMLDRLEL